MSGPTFDLALHAFCQALGNEGLSGLFATSTFVRQFTGQLQLVVPDDEFDAASKAANALREPLGNYLVDPPDAIVKLSSSSVQDRLHEALPEHVQLGDDIHAVRVIDLRSAGQDWLVAPTDRVDVPPRMVFWSLKGGVGRTTALVALAASLARSGRNVLVVDLDLEAPGVGDLLLEPEAKPLYGVVDYLAEDLVGNLDDAEVLSNIVGTSGLVQGIGLIDVCPAGGRLSAENPQNYMAKLFRAYPPKRSGDKLEHFAERIGRLVAGLETAKRYDAVLIDARAGMNESTAAALLALGADVLVFGHDTPQTFAGYRYVFAHLSRFALRDDAEWRLRLKMVHAKASVGRTEREAFRDKSFELMAESLYEQEGDFSFSPDDINGPHFPWVILDDSNYRTFDPISDPQHLDGPVFNTTFGDFIANARLRLRIDNND